MYQVRSINTQLRFKLVCCFVPTILFLSGCGAGEGSLVGTTEPSDQQESVVSSFSSPTTEEQLVSTPEEPTTPNDLIEQKPDVYIVKATSSNYDQSYDPEKTYDGSTDTDSRWSSNIDEDGSAPWIEYELSGPIEITQISIHFLLSDVRSSSFDVYLSADGETWGEPVLKRAVSSIIPYPATEYDPAQTFSLDGTGEARFLRIVGYGNSQPESTWTSIREIYIPFVTEDPLVPDLPEPIVEDPEVPEVVEETPTDEEGNPITPEEPITGDFTVTNASELQTALDQAVPGDVILLKDGNYGTLSIDRRQYDGDYVILRSENLYGAEFTTITSRYTDSSYFHFDRIKSGGVSIVGHPTQGKAAYLKFTNSLFTGLVSFREISDLTLHRNVINVDGQMFAVLIDEVPDLVVTQNFISRAQVDLMRVSGATDGGLIENNVFYDTLPKNIPAPEDPCRYDHTDGLQLFGNSGARVRGAPTNIIIRGNHFYDDPENNDMRPSNCGNVRIHMQGIFVSDPRSADGYQNVTIENNLLFIGSPNGIVMNGATNNVSITNNTVLPWPNGSGGSIRVRETVGVLNTDLIIRNNVASSVELGAEVTNESDVRADISGNYIYSRSGANSDSPNHYTQLFQGQGDGSRWQHFLPMPGSPVDFGSNLGAVNLLEALLDGELSVPAGFIAN